MITITQDLKTRYEFRKNHTMILSITASTTAGGVLRYQWFKDNVAVPGSSHTHEIHYSDFDEDKKGVYWCVVTDAADHKVESIHTMVGMDTSPPIITITGVTSAFTVAEDKTFSVTVSATTSEITDPLSYEWVCNGISYGEKATPTLTVPNANHKEHNGLWRCYVRSGTGINVTNSFRVTVERVPFVRIIGNPYTGAIKKYTQKILEVQVVSNTHYKAQWYSKLPADANWTLLEGENELHTVTDVLEVATSYKCEITYGTEVVVAQSNITLSGELGVVFSKQPTDPPRLYADQDVLLECEATSNEPEEYRNVFYQWYKGDEAIPGEYRTQLVLRNMQKADEGSYKCVVTVGTVSVDSNIAALVVDDRSPLIQITKQPTTDAERITGVPWSLNVEVNTNYPKPLTYQWQRDDGHGLHEVGENSPVLTINSPSSADDGHYTCRVSARGKSVGTNTATVSFHENKEATVTITTQPDAAQALMINEYINLHVEAHTNGFPFMYQWYKDGVAITGANKNEYFVLATTDKQSGSYTVKLTSGVTTVESRASNVVVEPNTMILGIKPLGNQVLKTGEKVKLKAEVTLSGTATLSYQWYKNGSPFAGKTTQELEVSAGANSFEHYRCQVTATHGETSCIATNQIWVAGLNITDEEHRHVHPLLHRNTSFVFMGYWVIDYINQCNAEKYNWVKNYKTSKYPLEIATILAGINLYGGNFALESRNGRLIACSLLDAIEP